MVGFTRTKGEEALKYTIISINDERDRYKKRIRQLVNLPEVILPAVHGAEVDLTEEYERRGLRRTEWIAKTGEAGVWLSNFDRWAYVATMDEPLIVFEDDAIVNRYFDKQLELFMEGMPENWDYVALWVPENQRIDYAYDVVYNELGVPDIRGTVPYNESRFKHSLRVAHVYQGYGMVAMMYSPAGGKKLVELAQRTGIDTPVDCFVYQQAHAGNLDGYAPTPIFANMVEYNWTNPSHVQQTEMFL